MYFSTDLEKPPITSGNEILKLGLRKSKGWGGFFVVLLGRGRHLNNFKHIWIRKAGERLEVFTIKKQTDSHRNLAAEIPSACVITLLSTAEQLCSRLLRETRNKISGALLGTQRAIYSSSFQEDKTPLEVFQRTSLKTPRQHNIAGAVSFTHRANQVSSSHQPPLMTHEQERISHISCQGTWNVTQICSQGRSTGVQNKIPAC